MEVIGTIEKLAQLIGTIEEDRVTYDVEETSAGPAGLRDVLQESKDLNKD